MAIANQRLQPSDGGEVAEAERRHPPSRREVQELAERQHGIVARAQLLRLGLSPQAITHRIASGRLHPVFRGGYALGRPAITQHGHWMAAVLRCGRGAVLSHRAAAALWEIAAARAGAVEVTIPAHAFRRSRGIVVHRRALGANEVTTQHRIPVTTPVCTLLDIAASVTRDELEAAVNGADKIGLVDPQTLRSFLEHMPKRPGMATLRALLDRPTFTLTDSELERRLLPLARQAGLPVPLTQQLVNGLRVDFYWPKLGLVVETDGLRYHRTPGQQARDRFRDQVNTASGLTCLRFTHSQVRYQPDAVRRTLAAVARRLAPS